MVLRIDPTFSVYDLVKNIQQHTSTMNHRQTMQVISSEIENATIKDSANTVIFASFQRLSRFLPQEKRYRQLAANSEHVYVFGVPDAYLPAINNLTYVPIRPADKLAKEWFLISYGKDYFSALATEELSQMNAPDEQRIFKGTWTFDLNVVATLTEWLSALVGWHYDEHPLNDYNFSNQVALLGRTNQRLQQRIVNCRRSTMIRSELGALIQSGVKPALQAFQQNPLAAVYPALV